MSKFKKHLFYTYGWNINRTYASGYTTFFKTVIQQVYCIENAIHREILLEIDRDYRVIESLNKRIYYIYAKL